MRVLVAAFVLVASVASAQTRWEAELAAFDEADRAAPPAPGGIVFVGSSSIKIWDLAKYFPDLQPLNRGIASSSMGDAARDVDRLVIRYAPRLVVLYAGDNDIDGGVVSEVVAVGFERFVRAIREKLPETRIVYIGIKPSPDRWDVIERVRLANNLIRAYASHDDKVAFVDVDHAMLGWDERPRPELYTSDGLHLTAAAYELWTALLRPLLVPTPAPLPPTTTAAAPNGSGR